LNNHESVIFAGMKRTPITEKQELGREVLKRMAYIALGILVALPVWNETGPLRLIGLSLLFSGYHLLKLFIAVILFLEDQWYKSPDEQPGAERREKSTKRLGVFVTLVLLSLLISWKTMGRTLLGTELFLNAAAIGLLTTLLFLLVYVVRNHCLIPRKHLILFGTISILGVPVIFGCAGLWINRLTATGPLKTAVLPIIEREMTTGRRNRKGHKYYAFVLIDGKTQSIPVGSKAYEKAEDQLMVTTKTGCLGYAYILAFE
jgi:hypothetical protein